MKEYLQNETRRIKEDTLSLFHHFCRYRWYFVLSLIPPIALFAWSAFADGFDAAYAFHLPIWEFSGKLLSVTFLIWLVFELPPFFQLILIFGFMFGWQNSFLVHFVMPFAGILLYVFFSFLLFCASCVKERKLPI